VHRHSLAVRHEPRVAAPLPATPLHEAAPVDLESMRLVLRQHLDELRERGVDETVLRPIEAELRRYDETVDHLTQNLR
jgi:hypothetical protein